MKIGELAQKTGLTIDTIRFYEKKGLIDSNYVQRQANGYRDYTEQVVERITLIQRGKRLGFTLTEIQQFIQDWETNTLSIEQKETILKEKIFVIDEQIKELQQMRDYLIEKIIFVRSSLD